MRALIGDFYLTLSEFYLIKITKVFLKRILPTRIIIKLLYFVKKNSSEDFYFKNKYHLENKILVFFTPDYGNLGDLAIYDSQIKFFKDTLPWHEIVEIPLKKTIEGVFFFRNKMFENDLVTLLGGGCFGDLNVEVELYRQMIVRKFENSFIVSFPQTVNFSTTRSGQKILNKSKRIYCKHNRLLITVRDINSFNFIKSNFPKVETMLIPDLVFYKNISSKYRRIGIKVSLRKDKEIDNDERKSLAESRLFEIFERNIEEISNIIEVTNTSIMEIQQYELKQLLIKIASSRIVITDRLHGMIFCYITQTPCIVINDKYKKVQGSYNWIKKAPFIKFLNIDIFADEIIDFIEFYLSNEVEEYKIDFKEKFDELKHYIYSNINKLP
ncbi:MAG: polysaccharide pyruvyl transferase family protein [Saprospiraceae bacterium]|nr:polysaccharide pyruvyl transferase family protein [Saprospiraceae bacterium]